MKVAVEGCAHGELEKIYETISFLENQGNFKVDLLICCGDFQSTRNTEDLDTMAVPPKFRTMCTFHSYYSGVKVAPVLTIFIGGNHEASNYLQELPYGGWVAPNIYYMGYAGVINVAGIRIGGLSGIYKGNDYYRGRFEYPPYSESTKRSVYHVRNIEVFRIKQIKSHIQIFMTHDWPRGIYNYGNVKQLIKRKPFFEEEVNENKLGSPASEELLFHIKPKFWFAGHLHVKFPAYVTHDNNEVTKFLALDKCLPKRKFLQILDIERDEKETLELQYDLEWLSILHYTNHLISIDPTNNYMPSEKDDERSVFTPTEDEKEFILKKMGGNLKIPLNFNRTAPTFQPQSPRMNRRVLPRKNKQTEEFCQRLGIDDPMDLILKRKGEGFNSNFEPEADQSVSFIDSDISGVVSEDETLEPEKECTPKRSSLVLPPPKCESTPDVISDDSLFFIDDGSKRSIDDSISSPIAEPAQGNKKFKRRNQSLYQSDS